MGRTIRRCAYRAISHCDDSEFFGVVSEVMAHVLVLHSLPAWDEAEVDIEVIRKMQTVVEECPGYPACDE